MGKKQPGKCINCGADEINGECSNQNCILSPLHEEHR